MIIDLERFVAEERPAWQELDALLGRMEADAGLRLGLDEIRRFHELYQRAAADLGKVQTFAANTELRTYLAALVARAYGEIHGVGDTARGFRPVAWLFGTLPRTFRNHVAAFLLAVSVMAAGGVFGGLAVVFDPDAKSVLLPFGHLQGDPSERVAAEESAEMDELEGAKMTFASTLMTHNTRVSIATLTLGITWGIGTLITLFYNGVILGAVVLDYIRAGEAVFLTGWLLPHGSIEIPAILVAGQAGFILAGAMLGHGEFRPLRLRLRGISSDLVTLVAGAALLLIWAGIVESFFSQYHAPRIPYGLKIAFGAVQLGLLAAFLTFGGRTRAGGRTHP